MDVGVKAVPGPMDEELLMPGLDCDWDCDICFFVSLASDLCSNMLSIENDDLLVLIVLLLSILIG